MPPRAQQTGVLAYALKKVEEDVRRLIESSNLWATKADFAALSVQIDNTQRKIEMTVVPRGEYDERHKVLTTEIRETRAAISRIEHDYEKKIDRIQEAIDSLVEAFDAKLDTMQEKVASASARVAALVWALGVIMTILNGAWIYAVHSGAIPGAVH